jgi:tyrosine decarboxylase / aspartate 1-decarboxylase
LELTGGERLLANATRTLFAGYAHLPECETIIDAARSAAILDELAVRLRDNLPYHHPLYIGQMLKPPDPIAQSAYALAMHLNPNNHALDGGRATSIMEKECVAEIGRMFGWDTCLGHLSSGGTFANLEALWIARELAPRKTILASAQAHYTHRRVSAVLQIPFEEVPADGFGRMDLAALESRLKAGGVGAVVATLGTTGLGAVDPLHEIIPLCRKHGVRVHIDAAYGGYFTLIETLRPETKAAFDAIGEADSIVVDPHKHGLQPYGCGCVLFRDPSVGRFYRHDSPYTYFTSDELHLGEISLECSRPGASAAALWATMKLLPLVKGGEFAKLIEMGRSAALELHRRLKTDERFMPLLEPELDIVVWAARSASASESSRLAQRLFDEAAKRDLHLALIRIPRALCRFPKDFEWDAEDVVCLRACAMKPEHFDWIDEIWSRLDEAAG